MEELKTLMTQTTTYNKIVELYDIFVEDSKTENINNEFKARLTVLASALNDIKKFY